MANTRGQGLVPAKLRATGNKGSIRKEKPPLGVRDSIHMLKAAQEFRRGVKNAKIILRREALLRREEEKAKTHTSLERLKQFVGK